MTPENKAAELMDKFRGHVDLIIGDKPECWTRNAKACAIISVDEIINLCDVQRTLQRDSRDVKVQDEAIRYFQAVKVAIEKM